MRVAGRVPEKTEQRPQEHRLGRTIHRQYDTADETPSLFGKLVIEVPDKRFECRALEPHPSDEMRCSRVPGRSVTPIGSLHLAHRITGKNAVTLSKAGRAYSHEVMRQANRRFTNKNAQQRRRVGHDRLTSRPTRL